VADGDERWLRYERTAGVHDEMLDAEGATREPWRPLVESLEPLGPAELARRWEGARRLIRENGVTYNVYGDPRGTDRPWELDPLPLVLGPDEWARVRGALAQRARLLDAILADVYGEQKLLREGHLPPELVFAHPGYLRACHGAPARLARLTLYAADLARAPNGDWWVLGDRTQAPSGAGYALENRLVSSRTLPEAFRESRVERLAGFFQRLQHSLRALAPRHVANPRVVLLTPGPYNETYFEHAYLARYLGFTLVEGGDLTVRDRAVFLKTLGGLEPIDVILRRVDDGFCDPLSLRSDSSLGIAGLVHAVRAGNVAVANALGSGLAESPALLAFLPGLCRALLGEELALPSVATWWCGHEEALGYVQAHLDELVLKPAFPYAGLEPVFGAHLSAAERAALLAQIRARPHAFVAQEQVALSTAPVFAPEGVRARPLVLRAYAAACEDHDWEVMPGGLTRVAVAPDSLVVSMQRGGGSKDTWVCSAGTPSAVTLLRPAGAPVELTRGGAELPSRVADNLFWLGRYLERCEGAARLARAIIARISGEGADGDASLPALIDALARSGAIEEGASHEGRAFLDRVFANESPRSVRATLAAVQQLAFVLRDQISLDTWRVLSELQQDASGPSAASWSLSAARDALNRMIVRLSAWSGLTMESMTRTLGWRFADMGRRIERATWVATLLDACLVETGDDEPARLEALLEVAESGITYRRRYRGELQVVAVLDLLLSDETNPRSVGFQLAALEEHLAQVRGVGAAAERTQPERVALAALARVRLADVAELCRVDAGKRLRLAELLARTTGELPALSDALTRSYLSHAGEARRIERF